MSPVGPRLRSRICSQLPVLHVVAEQADTTVEIGDHQIQIAVQVVVGDRQAAADMRCAEALVERCQVMEVLALAVPQQHVRLWLERLGLVSRLQGAAVGHHQIEPAVGVEVGELGTPTDRMQGDLPDTQGGSQIGETESCRRLPALALLQPLEVRQSGVVEGVLLRDPVGDEQVEVTVPVPIRRSQTHGTAIVGHQCVQTDIFEGVAPIEKEGVVRDVVGYIEIEATVGVEVLPEGAEAAASQGSTPHREQRRPRRCRRRCSETGGCSRARRRRG